MSTEQQLRLQQDAYQVHARLLVADADGMMRDLADTLGYDPLIHATWQESMDLSCATGQITLGRGHGDFNLSPLMTGPAVNSPARALDGVIDNINAAGPDDTIVLEVRDRGGRLLNHVIKGSADPDPGGPQLTRLEHFPVHAPPGAAAGGGRPRLNAGPECGPQHVAI